MAITLKSYRTDFGTKAVLVGDHGRKYMPVLMMDGGEMAVRKVPLEEARYMKDLGPLRPKHVKTFRQHGRKFGITSTAREFLKLSEV